MMKTGAMTKVANLDRHLTCANYSKEDNCPFESISLLPGEKIEIVGDLMMQLVFMYSGSVSYIASTEGKTFRETKPFALLLGAEQRVVMTATEPSSICFFKFARPHDLCQAYAVDTLKLYTPSHLCTHPLYLKSPIVNCLHTLIGPFSDGLKCNSFFNMKLKELFWLLSAYYAPEDLGIFLAPLLRRSIDFKEFVENNFMRVATIQELADMRGITQRQFKVEFHEHFGMPPYAWMLKEKSKLIDEQLANPSVPFSEIIELFKFSSPSHFTVFCKKQFKMTPSQRRKVLIKEEAFLRSEALRRGVVPRAYIAGRSYGDPNSNK